MTTIPTRKTLADELLNALKQVPDELAPRDQKARCLVARDAWRAHIHEADNRRVVRYWDDPQWSPEGAIHQVEIIERRGIPRKTPSKEVA